MQKITPFLWFDDNAEEAVNFYTSIFNDSKIISVARYDEAGAAVSGRQKGSVMTAAFKLNGQEFIALNGGPAFKFTEAISFVVNCESQKEVDYYWDKLTSDGGQESMCGWLKDKYGVSWQIVPAKLFELLSSKEPGKSQRVIQKVLGMKKLNIAEMEKAYTGN